MNRSSGTYKKKSNIHVIESWKEKCQHRTLHPAKIPISQHDATDPEHSPQRQQSTQQQSTHSTWAEYILRHKINLPKFKRLEIIQHVCSHHNGIKREINDRKIREKSPNTWKLNNTFPNNPWVNEEVSREIKKKDTLNQMQTKCNILKFVGHSQTVLKWSDA